jgi:hypothetical protein
MTYEEVLGHFHGVRHSGENRAKALCPAHDDHNPTLDIDRGKNGGTVIKCRAGCATDAVLAAATPPLTMADLFPSKTEAPKHNGRGPCVAEYLYQTIHGKLAYKSCRFQFPGSQ